MHDAFTGFQSSPTCVPAHSMHAALSRSYSQSYTVMSKAPHKEPTCGAFASRISARATCLHQRLLEVAMASTACQPCSCFGWCGWRCKRAVRKRNHHKPKFEEAQAKRHRTPGGLFFLDWPATVLVHTTRPAHSPICRSRICREVACRNLREAPVAVALARPAQVAARRAD